MEDDDRQSVRMVVNNENLVIPSREIEQPFHPAATYPNRWTGRSFAVTRNVVRLKRNVQYQSSPLPSPLCVLPICSVAPPRTLKPGPVLPAPAKGVIP